MQITRFNKQLASRCIEIFLSNLGKFFDPSEFEMFESFLKNERLIEEFYVAAEENVIVGCGGFELTGPQQVDLNWGMVHGDFHRHGYGTALLRYRLERIKKLFGEVIIRVETSQYSKGFFEKHDFETKETKLDGFGPNIDYVLMIRTSEQGAHGTPPTLLFSMPHLTSTSTQRSALVPASGVPSLER